MVDELLLAARIGAPKGLKGEAALILHTDRPEDVFVPGAVFETGEEDPETLTVRTVRVQGNRLMVSFEEASDRTAVEPLVGLQLFVEPEDEEDAWYPAQLAGLRVENTDGEVIGEVTDLRPGTAHDFLIVDASGEEVMVPFAHALVPEVNVEDGYVVVEPPEGLFPTPENTEDEPATGDGNEDEAGQGEGR